jgi:hypothetical protein
VQTCRRERLERTLIWNQRHLLHALREFERFYNGHRPHQGIANARRSGPAFAHHQPEPDRPPGRKKTRVPGRDPPRIRACRLTCTDEIFDKSKRHRALSARWPNPFGHGWLCWIVRRSPRTAGMIGKRPSKWMALPKGRV